MIRIGVICPSEIAYRRFMPALQKVKENFKFIGIAMASPEEWFGKAKRISRAAITEQQKTEYKKAESFIEAFSGKIFKSYTSLVSSKEIDAIYIPLPPALHYKWAKLALEKGKHVFIEKPATTCISDTDGLIKIASAKKLVLHENYMFVFHSQLTEIQDVINSGEIGDVRLYRLTFGFPRRSTKDFRYNKALGGGALLDAGGYTVKYATYLLGINANITAAKMNYIDNFEVDIFGSATMVNEKGVTAQLAFGIDNDYKCDIEVWGSKGSISSGRVFTSPEGFIPTYLLKKNQEYETQELSSDDAFKKSIEYFHRCINDEELRKKNYFDIFKQAQLISMVKELSSKNETTNLNSINKQ